MTALDVYQQRLAGILRDHGWTQKGSTWRHPAQVGVFYDDKSAIEATLRTYRDALLTYRRQRDLAEATLDQIGAAMMGDR